jgi:hypothetical protein
MLRSKLDPEAFVSVAESANSYAALARTKKHWASKAKVTAAVTVKGVETLMTTTRTNAKRGRLITARRN